MSELKEDSEIPPGRGEIITSAVIDSMHTFFYKYGLTLGTHPWRFIWACLLLTALGSVGLTQFHQEKNPTDLWVPRRGSTFRSDTRKLLSLFDEGPRVQSFLVTAPNVLEPSVLAKVQEIHERILSITTDDGTTWTDVCLRIPVLRFTKRTRRDFSHPLNTTYYQSTLNITSDEDDHTTRSQLEFKFKEDDELTDADSGVEVDDDYDPIDSIYCSILASTEYQCLTNSPLENWAYDPQQIRQLRLEDILDLVNNKPATRRPLRNMKMLGEILRDNITGDVISAGAMFNIYVAKVNFSAADIGTAGNSAGTSDLANGPGFLWEQKFLELMSTIAKEAEGMQVYYEAMRSAGDESVNAILQDVDKLLVGIIFMFVYVQIVLCKFNVVEMRFYLATAGVAGIALAFVVAVGVCSLIGIPYGPIHTCLPFLLMGIGVDDVFVVMAAWKNLSPGDKLKEIPEKLGLTLQHAGTSITITSLTNAIAFAVGATSNIPSLSSFCIYAAMGVAVTFVFQITLFTACLALDERRVARHGNSLVVCYQHKHFKPNTCSQQPYMSRVFKYIYSNIIFSKTGKICVILASVIFTAVSIKGNMELKQEFEVTWFIPQDSYHYKFLMERKRTIAEFGIAPGGIYIGAIDYGAEMGKIHELVAKLKKEKWHVLESVTEWYTGFREYVNGTHDRDVATSPLSDTDFRFYLSKFLFTPTGARYQKNFRFARELVCGEPAPPIVMSYFDLKLRVFAKAHETGPAMNRLYYLASKANFTTGDRYATAWSRIFGKWLTDKVMSTELYYNMGIASVCIMICTAVFIADLRMCVFICMCIALTLVNVSGMMHFCGLTIEITTCVGLQMAAGLCVDYAAHIAHKFLSSSGTRLQRCLATVTDIGPAVFSGGLSTLLALSLLGFSQSYVFVSFFKVFSLVVLFGLFHGAVLLPVLLSIFGPSSAPDNTEGKSKEDKYKNKNKIHHAFYSKTKVFTIDHSLD